MKNITSADIPGSSIGDITSVGNNSEKGSSQKTSNQIQASSISLPKGGGAIKNIDEKFSVNAANGTSGFSVPFPFSPSRNGFMPGITLGYNSGGGNGTFGLGWSGEPPSIVRRTDKKLPRYNDLEESDVFMISGAEDLVPSFRQDSGEWIKDERTNGEEKITKYRPRVEGTFAKIEKITEANKNIYWKVTSKDNIVSIFGKSKNAQINDPGNDLKIFKWFLEFSYDDKGNCFQCEYLKENKLNVPNLLHEKNRLNNNSSFTNTYLKRVKYCNKNHFDRATLDFTQWESFLSANEYLLQLVLDYGDHNLKDPQPQSDQDWTCRNDSFSDYRAGFEIRTHRLCRRILMFHQFQELGINPCLVRSLNMDYESGPSFTFLTSISQKGFIRKSEDTYSEKSMPPLEFNYEKVGWNIEVKSLPEQSLENLPVGIDDHSYQWIDLYGEGLNGILTEQSTGWYYKRNLGGGILQPAKLISPQPSLTTLSSGNVHFQDIEANGQKYLVSEGLHGFFEFSPEEEWLPFKAFNEIPAVDIHDPNLKFLDLDGDGRADILISEEEVFVWYESKGKEGFESSRTVRKSIDEENGPNIVFADDTQSILVADMSGDGLMDIVRIRNRDIVYWPNLGYGKFGAKVSMSNAPMFDQDDHFNPAYLKLADIDGSGTTDIVYFGNDSFRIYFNQSGNNWSQENGMGEVNPLPFPKIDNQAKVNVIDLLGNGTGCIVWSSPLPSHSSNPLRYIDLMNGKKPHIMTSYKNNMGKEVSIYYKPSTFFYLEDKKAGTPWISKLPFPVHCVSEMEVVDKITKTRITNQYTYHHGYYDYIEREFRGFGRVDQTDTENFEQYKKNSDPNGNIQLVDEGIHQPPMLTKTWYHTGAFLDKEKILNQFAHEYFINEIVPEKQLEEPALSFDWTAEEWREALRSCKGMPLHVEVYSLDLSAKEKFPYTTTQHTCKIQLLQPRLENLYGVFTVLECESLSYTYERDPADPRISHSMNIEVDEFGNVLKAAAITYGRKTIDNSLTAEEQAEQNKLHIIFSENIFTNKIEDTDYHLPVRYEAKTFELTGAIPLSGPYFSIEEIRNNFQISSSIPYQNLPTPGMIEKRLINHGRSLFLKNDLTGSLALGVIESLLLPYQSYQLALTPDLITSVFGDKVTDDLLINQGKYFKFEDGNYWIASGTQTFDANHFYQVTEVTDPFGYQTHIVYDVPYHFFIQQTTDELQNKSEVLGFNFRTLSPYLMLDQNDNRTGIRTDELGMVNSTFVMAKENETKGDFMDMNIVEASSNDQPTNILEYDLFNYLNQGKPNFIKTLVRETHYFQSLETGHPVSWQSSYSYSDGGGNVMLKKVQAEPGLALQEDEDGTVTEVDTTPNLRWIGNGRTILNNKGNPVKQYQPYFSTTFEFEDAKELVERGVSANIFYDTAGRAIRTDFPDGTFIKLEFNSWMQKSYDQNDTVLESQWYKDRIILPIPEIATPAEITAANKAAVHANTPSVVYIDSMGKGFLSVADNGVQGKYKTHIENDIEGNVRKITDARGNVMMQYKYDMLGSKLYQLSMDAGERWTIGDCMGKPLRIFDNRNHEFSFEYDALHRSTAKKVKGGDGPSTLDNVFERIIYGENLPGDKAKNLRGKPVLVYDTSGKGETVAFDFKGNAIESSRRFTRNYKEVVNWSGSNPDASLEPEFFLTTVTYDALNRITQKISPDNSLYEPLYNPAGLLEKVQITQNGTKQAFVKNIDYNEKRQRNKIIYGNDVTTNYFYHKKNFRLIHLETKRISGDPLQDLYYTFDPVGNITRIEDKSIPIEFFNNQKIEGISEYTYDALGQLKSASGREHAGQLNFGMEDNWNDLPFLKKYSANSAMEWRNYEQQYQYDAAGNILQMIHIAGTGSWTRDYTPDPNSNRLLSTKVGSTIYQYDLHAQHGYITAMPHLQVMEWNFKEELQAIAKQRVTNGVPETTYYVYDGNGQRTRKITERQASGGATPTRKSERIYVGGIEIYREYDNVNIKTLERQTYHVSDDSGRIAMIETRTVGSDDAPARLVRYQFGNHQGSASIETDETVRIISYEEFHPFGTTSYQATDLDTKAAYKRYRYTGMERDEESGLEYHSARYYLPWLGRWMSADPIGIKGGMNVFLYCNNNPVTFIDLSGNGPMDSMIYYDEKKKAEEDAANLKKQQEANAREQKRQAMFNKLDLDRNGKLNAYEVYTASNCWDPRILDEFLANSVSPWAYTNGGLIAMNEVLEPYFKAEESNRKQLRRGDDYYGSEYTYEQREAYEANRPTRVYNFTMASFDLINSIGVGEPFSGSAPEFRETQHGSPLELPSIKMEGNSSYGDLSYGVGGTGVREGGSRYRGTSSGKDCVRCVTSLIDAIENNGLVLTAAELPVIATLAGKAEFQGETQSLNYIMAHTNATFGSRNAEGLRGPGDYVVFNAFNERGIPGHIFWARVRPDGRTIFFDPQNNKTVLQRDIGAFSSYQIRYNTQK